MVTPIDQVIRREQFARAHPEVTFWFSGVHRATVRRSGTTHELAEEALRALLDRLDVIVAGSE